MTVLYKRIRDRREQLGMSQDDLAKKLGYKSRSSINKIEMGENDIPQSKIKSFAEALDTTTSYLMGWDEEIFKTTDKYYINDEVAELAQEIYDNPELRVLFDTTRKAKPEDLKLIAEMIKRLSGGND